jgi:peptidyl-prolyl cis-trans isomerase C
MDNNTLAKVGDIEISRRKMVDIMRTLPQQQAMEVSTIEGRMRLLDEMVAGELFYLDAIENGMDNNGDFQKIVEEAKHNLLQSFAIQQLVSQAKVTDEEMKAYYEANKEAYISEHAVTARHILVESEAEGNKAIEEIDNGLDFSDAAKKYSTCPSGASGGGLGSFTKGKMVPEFEEAAFNLEVGQKSGLVKTQFGYHVILVDQIDEANQKSYEDVEAEIRKTLMREKQNELYFEKVEALKKVYKVEINEEGLK